MGLNAALELGKRGKARSDLLPPAFLQILRCLGTKNKQTNTNMQDNWT